MRTISVLLALAAILATAAGAAACDSGAAGSTIVYRDCQPESRAWVSGHYEWIGDCWGYVPGHWVVYPAHCQTTEIDRCGETVVYVERPRERVVYVEPDSCERPREVCAAPRRSSHVDIRIDAPVIPLPVPLPIPFPLFRHHR